MASRIAWHGRSVVGTRPVVSRTAAPLLSSQYQRNGRTCLHGVERAVVGIDIGRTVTIRDTDCTYDAISDDPIAMLVSKAILVVSSISLAINVLF